jgi:signal transduction histidine kinase
LPGHDGRPPGRADDRLDRDAALAGRRCEHDDWERRCRLERQLHDGAALRISALTLQLGLFRHRLPMAEAALRESVDCLQEELHVVLQELRDVAGKIYPPLLTEAGLGPALREAADRLSACVRVEVPQVRFDPATEGVAYFAVTGCLEALTGDAPVEVLVRRDADVLVVRVIGVDVRLAEPMQDQVRRMGGTVDVAGGPGTGTIIARIPC